MIIGVEKELNIFLQAVLAGNFLRLLYMALRLIRNLIPHRAFWISLEDAIYWVFASGYLFLLLQKTSKGIIRWYFVVGLLGGSLITQYFLQKIMRKYIDKWNKRE